MINIYPERDYSEGNHRWSFCYLHGKAEDVFEQEVADMFEADEPKPTQEGNYLVIIDGHPAIAVIRMRFGTMSGRVSLIDDTEALKHALTPEDWR